MGLVKGSGECVGGVTGLIGDNVRVLNSYNTGRVEGAEDVGGVVGYMIEKGLIQGCYNTGWIQGNIYVGGITGRVHCDNENREDAVVRFCYNVGEIRGNKYAGGLVGVLNGTTAYCYTSAGVCKWNGINYNSGNDYIGNVLGYAGGGSIFYCYWNRDKETGGVNRDIGGQNKESYVKDITGIINEQFIAESALWDSMKGLIENAEQPFTKRGNTDSCCGQIAYYPELKVFVDSGDLAMREHSKTSAIGKAFAGGALSDMEDFLISGNGTDSNPYLISTAEQLNHLRKHIGNNFCVKQQNDISLAKFDNWEPIGTESAYYTGVYNGDGRTISNLRINRQTQNHVGLFGNSGGKIYDLHITGSDIVGNTYVGGIAGRNFFGEIRGCSYSGRVLAFGYAAGGIVGSNFGSHALVNECEHKSGNVYAEVTQAGGIAGSNTHGLIKQCVNSGGIIYSGGNNAVIGGIVGINNGDEDPPNNPNGGRIFQCVNYCLDVNGDQKSGMQQAVGGIAGENWFLVDDCKNYGVVTGSYHTGGIVGRNYATVFKCVNETTGKVVTGEKAIGGGGSGVGGSGGGVVGFNEGDGTLGSVSLCGNEGVVSSRGASYLTGGVVGNNHMGTVEGCYNNGSVTGGLAANESPTGTDSAVGGVAGINDGKEGDRGLIKNSGSTGTVNGTGDRVGGVVGRVNSADVNNCSNNGTVTGKKDVGGLVGRIDYGNISQCYNIGRINGTENVGGICGMNKVGSISECFNSGNIYASNNNGGGIVGNHENNGLLGLIPATLSDCYNTGGVTGNNYVGGIAGSCARSEINRCYTAGSVNKAIGSIVGTPPVNCWYDNEKTSPDSSGVKGAATYQMAYQADVLLSDIGAAWVKRDNTADTWYYPELEAFYNATPESNAQIASRESVSTRPKHYTPSLTLSVVTEGDESTQIIRIKATLTGAGSNANRPIQFIVDSIPQASVNTGDTGVAIYEITELEDGKQYNIVSSFDGDAYNRPTTASASHVFGKLNQMLEISGVPDTITFGEDPFSLSATGVGPGGVTWESSNINIVKVDGNGEVTIIGAGTARITATKEGNQEYNPASVFCELKINRADQPEFAFAISPSDPMTFSPDFSFTNTASGGAGNGNVTYAITSVDGNAFIDDKTGEISQITACGNLTVTATKEEDANYNSATAQYELTITKATPVISDSPVASVVWKGSKLSDSMLTGSVDVHGTLTWKDPDVLADESGIFDVVFNPVNTNLYNPVETTAELTVVDKSELEELIQTARGILNAAVLGEGHGEYTQAAWKDFSDAIRAAQEITSSAPTIQQDIDDAIYALEQAIELFGISPNSIDASRLLALIQTATDKKDTATYGDRNGDYAPEQEQALGSAIEAAREIAEKSNRTTAEIEQALSDLQTAIDSFNSTQVEVRYTELISLINVCNSIYEDAVEGEDDGQYLVGSKEVFKAAIETAEDFVDAYVRQDDVDEAVSALQTARGIFAGKIVGVNFDILKALITQAQDKADNSNYGDKNGEYPESAKEVLENAITEARITADDQSSTQEQVDVAADALEQAIELFGNAKIIVEYQRFKDLLATAKNAKLLAVEGDGHDQTPAVAMTALQDAIDAAQLVADNNYLSQATVNAAFSVLTQAITDFGAAKVNVDFTTLDEKIIEAKTIPRGNYTTALWDALQTAIDGAETVRATQYVTQAAVDDALAALTAAITGLRNNTSGGGGSSSVNPPTASQKSGDIVINSVVRLSTTYKEGKIYYTTDGTTPTKESTLYTEAITIDKDMSVKAIVISGGRTSSAATFTYAVRAAKVSFKDKASEIKYMKSHGDKFDPDMSVTRYEMLSALALLLDVEKVDTGKAFSDVADEYRELVTLFAGAGIIDGFSDGTFGGEKGLTRAEFEKIMSIILGLDIKDGKSNFSDMAGHWSEKYVAEFEKLGFIKGYPDGTFQPDTQMTRAEFVAIVNRIIGVKAASVPPVFADLHSGHWAYGDIMAVYLK